MEIVILGILFTISILLIIGIILIGRELRQIRVLLERGTKGIEGYLDAILEEDGAEDNCVQNMVTNEEKKMLWDFDPEQVLNEVIGDIF